MKFWKKAVFIFLIVHCIYISSNQGDYTDYRHTYALCQKWRKNRKKKLSACKAEYIEFCGSNMHTT